MSALVVGFALLQVNHVIKGHYNLECNWVWIELDTAVDWSRHASMQKPFVCEATGEVNIITSCLPYQSGLENSIKPSLSDLLIHYGGITVKPEFLFEYPQTPVRFLSLLKDPVCSTGARLPYFSSVLSRTSVICACIADRIRPVPPGLSLNRCMVFQSKV